MHIVYIVCTYQSVQLCSIVSIPSVKEYHMHAIIKLLKCTIIPVRSCNRGIAVTFDYSIIQVMWAILEGKTVVIIILAC